MEFFFIRNKNPVICWWFDVDSHCQLWCVWHVKTPALSGELLQSSISWRPVEVSAWIRWEIRLSVWLWRLSALWCVKSILCVTFIDVFSHWLPGSAPGCWAVCGSSGCRSRAALYSTSFNACEICRMLIAIPCLYFEAETNKCYKCVCKWTNYLIIIKIQ